MPAPLCLSTSIGVFTGTCSKTKRESEGGGDQGAEARSGGHSNCWPQFPLCHSSNSGIFESAAEPHISGLQTLLCPFLVVVLSACCLMVLLNAQSLCFVHQFCVGIQVMLWSNQCWWDMLYFGTSQSLSLCAHTHTHIYWVGFLSWVCFPFAGGDCWRYKGINAGRSGLQEGGTEHWQFPELCGGNGSCKTGNSPLCLSALQHTAGTDYGTTIWCPTHRLELHPLHCPQSWGHTYHSSQRLVSAFYLSLILISALLDDKIHIPAKKEKLQCYNDADGYTCHSKLFNTYHVTCEESAQKWVSFICHRD